MMMHTQRSALAPTARPTQLDRAALIDDLVSGLCPPQPGCDERARQAAHNALFGLALRVADSAIAGPAAADGEITLHNIRQRLIQAQRGDDAARLTELVQRLGRLEGLSPRARSAALGVLQALAGANSTNSSSAAAAPAYKPLQLPKVLPMVGGSSAGGAGSSSSSGGGAGHASLDTSRPRVGDQRSKLQRGRPVAAPGSLQEPKGAHWGEPNAGSSDVSMVKQPALVRDMLRAARGVTGVFAAAAPSHDPSVSEAGLLLPPQSELPLLPGVRVLLHELGELGLMYRHVQAAVTRGAAAPRGTVHQALCGALAEQVTDYYRLLALLEDQLSAPLPVPGGADSNADDTDSSSDAGAGAGRPYLTLRRLQLWLGEPLRRMRLLSALVDACEGRVGGNLAGTVWAATKGGDPLATADATRLLHQVCAPLLDMTRSWVYEGVLQDPYKEFFVVPCGGGGSSAAASTGNGAVQRDGWRDCWRLEPAKLPPFVPAGLATTILRAGKSLNFLRDACGDGAWTSAWAPGAVRAAAGLGYAQLPQLEAAVVEAAAAVDARLMQVLRGSGELERHCSALRAYVLLGQGDFVSAALDSLGPELSRPAGEVSEATLNHLLRSALLSSAAAAGTASSARGEDDTVERLRARKGPAGAGETGWDVFSLSYSLGPPLNSVFTPAAQAAYARLGRLLWLLARTERSLGAAWHTLKVEVERSLARLAGETCAPRMGALLRACLRLRSEMAHLVGNLQTYVNTEVLECAWAEFLAASRGAADLDGLITAHERFLAGATARALLGDGAAEALRPLLAQLLRVCMGLHPLTGRFNERVQAVVLARERRTARAAANTAAGRWGDTAATDAVAEAAALADAEVVELAGQLGQLADSYRGLVRRYLSALPAAADEAGAEVRFLLARLNFSDFYSRDA